MAAKSRIAEAYLQIVATTEGIGESLAKELEKGYEEANEKTQDETVKASEETGKKSGKALAVGLAAAGIATALAGIFQDAMNEAIGQLEGGATIEARLNLSEEESAKAQQTIDNLFKGGYGESREEVQEAMSSIMGTIKGAREMSAEELEKMGRDILNMSSTFGAEAGEINKAANTMIASGMVDNFDEAVSTITGGFQVMGEYGDDWLDTLNEYSDDFKTFGLEGEDAIKFLQAGIEAGARDTDKLADALNEMSITLTDGSIDDVITKMGMNPDDLRARIAEGGDAAQGALLEVMSSLQETGNTADYMKFMSSMGEDFQSVFQNMDLSIINESLEEGLGNMEKMNETIASTPAAVFQDLKRDFDGAFVDLMIPVLETVTPLLASFAGWLEENEWFVKVLAVAVGVVFVAALIASTIALWSFAAAAWAAVVPLLPVIGTVLLVVAAVIAVIAIIWLLWDNWDAVWGFIKDVAGAVGQWFVDLWNGIKDWFVDLWNGIGEFFTGLWQGITDFFVGIWDGVIGWFVDAWNGVGNFFIGLWEGLLNFFIGVYNQIVDLVAKIPGGQFSMNVIGDITGTGFGQQAAYANIPRLANGGTIPARNGGTLAVLGEAGRAEVVMDAGKWNNLLDNLNSGAVGSGGEKNVTFNITQKENESTEDLVQRINQHLDFTGLRG